MVQNFENLIFLSKFSTRSDKIVDRECTKLTMLLASDEKEL